MAWDSPMLCNSSCNGNASKVHLYFVKSSNYCFYFAKKKCGNWNTAIDFIETNLIQCHDRAGPETNLLYFSQNWEKTPGIRFDWSLVGSEKQKNKKTMFTSLISVCVLCTYIFYPIWILSIFVHKLLTNLIISAKRVWTIPEDKTRLYSSMTLTTISFVWFVNFPITTDIHSNTKGSIQAVIYSQSQHTHLKCHFTICCTPTCCCIHF